AGKEELVDLGVGHGAHPGLQWAAAPRPYPPGSQLHITEENLPPQPHRGPLSSGRRTCSCSGGAGQDRGMIGSLISGIVAVVIALGLTALAALVWPTPWTLQQAMVAVGTASFFAAFFAQIGRKQGEDYRETIVFNRGGGEVRHMVGNAVMKPKFLGGEEPDTAGKDRRALLADWLTAPDNPFFARNVSNRIWAHFFGKGIVEPVDDVRVSNPPSNPELLDALADKLIEYNYDFKAVVRDICNSQAYQRSTVRNESNAQDELNFAHGNVRRIQAEMMLDCISQATQTKDKFQGLPLGARAVQIADGRTSTYFLTTFGRATRETVCACEVVTDPNLSQALHLLNGDTVQNKIGQGGLVKTLLDGGKTPEQAIESIYIRCLSRKPNAEETAKLMEVVQQAANPQQGLEDVFWAVLNSREFIFNH
ncbi:MAG: DUF1553 domain-containing protein, partial [Planctomycetes bacterium]|nr:DUF1553 domain-containing protein [Planctomycetota bacterium]